MGTVEKKEGEACNYLGALINANLKTHGAIS
jgi:hypothetical protein